MWGKVLGVCLVLAVGGGAAGYAVAESRPETPARIDRVQPVVASGPAYPTTPAVTVLPDPSTPPLGTDLPTTIEVLSTGKHGSKVSVGIPTGWVVNRQTQVRWTWTQAGNPYNTYGLRIDVIAGSHQSVSNVKDARIQALREADRNGALDDFELTRDVGDTFVATYVQDGYRRVTFERIVSLGQTTASADVAVTGRLMDRDGLMDLLARTTASMVLG